MLHACWMLKFPSLVIQHKSGKKQNHSTQLLDKTGSEESPVPHCSPVHKGYLSRNNYLIVLN